MHDPIAYTYDADYHCPDCALRAFGRTEDGFIAGQNDDGSTAEDSEGNPVGVVAPWDSGEWPEGMHCGDCGGEIIEAEDDDGTYSIVRFRFDGDNEIVESGLTLDEAQAHCQRDDTHGDGWFDGYRED